MIESNSIVVPQNDQIKLYIPLKVSPELFMEAYNLKIEAFVERNKFKEEAQSKGGKNQLKRDILYLSYSHAYRLFRRYFPNYEVDCVVNPETGGYIFKEIDDRGYFIKSFIHDGSRRSAAYYYGVLNTAGMGVFPADLELDYNTKAPKPGKWVANEQLFNKSVYRAKVKAIALATGIGLKLWTGDDLDEDTTDAKMSLIMNVQRIAEMYAKESGREYNLPDLNYMTPEVEIKQVGRELQEAYRKVKEGLSVTEPTVLDNTLLTSELDVDTVDSSAVVNGVDESLLTESAPKKTRNKQS